MDSGRKRLAWAYVMVLLIAAGACAEAIAPGTAEVEVPCTPGVGAAAFPDMPLRAGPPAVTTGSVPHRQIDPDVVPEVIDDMSARIFALTDIESRPSGIVDGATALWLRQEFNLGRPECLVQARELGHIHQDGSLHVTVPHGRIPGAAAAGWIEQHPWSATFPGFEAYVMIFSPRDPGEVEIILELVTDGINFVVGS